MKILLDQTESDIILDVECALSDFVDTLESIGQRGESQEISDLSAKFDELCTINFFLDSDALSISSSREDWNG